MPFGLRFLPDDLAHLEQLLRLAEGLPDRLPRVRTGESCRDRFDAGGRVRVPHPRRQLRTSLPRRRSESHIGKGGKVVQRSRQVVVIDVCRRKIDGDGVPPVRLRDGARGFMAPADGDANHGAGSGRG